MQRGVIVGDWFWKELERGMENEEFQKYAFNSICSLLPDALVEPGL